MLIRRPLLSPRALLTEESRASIAATVSWMLTFLITAAAVVVAGGLYVSSQQIELDAKASQLLRGLASLVLLSAVFTGLLCLVLTVVVYRVRRESPPIAITVAAVIVSCFPLATMLLLSLRG